MSTGKIWKDFRHSKINKDAKNEIISTENVEQRETTQKKKERQSPLNGYNNQQDEISELRKEISDLRSTINSQRPRGDSTSSKPFS